ncbi:MAG: class I SAM-dependent methyltransferase [bacterium]|nr:class I SAM-dependent methyltransferase [bacterium]
MPVHGSESMTGHDERFRPIETAPEWSHEVFDTCAELTGLLETHAYRYAKTMPGAPHSYTLKRTWEDEEEFVEALRKMRAVERIEEFFRGSWYRRFCANGYKYWTMGASLDHILVNRAIHAIPFDSYAGICDVYDLAIHKTKADVERSQRVYDALEITSGTDILDIGCGTGSLVDFRFQDIRPERYVGIDPSRGMLGVFRDKHPEFHDRLIRTSFEDYWPKPGQTFDLIVALVGVASHIGEPDLLSRKVRWLLKPGGTAVLMYNVRQSGDMEFYRNLGINTPQGEMVSDEFWTVRQDEDPDWLTTVGGREFPVGNDGADGRKS